MWPTSPSSDSSGTTSVVVFNNPDINNNSIKDIHKRRRMSAQQEAAKAVANLLSKVARYSVVLGIGASVVQSSLYTVDGGERCIMYDRIQGVLEKPVGEGTHFRNPLVSDAKCNGHCK